MSKHTQAYLAEVIVVVVVVVVVVVAVVEVICKFTDIDAVTYERFFSSKDSRRGQFVTVAFHASYVEDNRMALDVFKGDERSLDRLFKYLPSIRKMVIEWAKDMDAKAELGSTKFQKRAEAALGPQPETLEKLLKMTLPLDKRYEPLSTNAAEKDNEIFNEVSRQLPESVTEYIEFAKQSFQIDQGNMIKFFMEATTTTTTTTTKTTTKTTTRPSSCGATRRRPSRLRGARYRSTSSRPSAPLRTTRKPRRSTPRTWPSSRPSPRVSSRAMPRSTRRRRISRMPRRSSRMPSRTWPPSKPESAVEHRDLAERDEPPSSIERALRASLAERLEFFRRLGSASASSKSLRARRATLFDRASASRK